MSDKRLKVWLGGLPVGELSQDAHGDLVFAYGASWLADSSSQAISVSLPKRPEPFPHRACLPFFDGLLPEGGQRSAIAKALGVSEKNPFSLLNELGGDVAGALQFLPPGTKPKSAKGPWVPQPLDDEALLAVLDRLPLRPMLAGEDGLRLSLAGAQAKLPVCVVTGRVCLPQPGQPTTHILKPAIPGLRASVENEAFAMHLAAELGIPVAQAEPRIVRASRGRKQTYLLVTRYDRTSSKGLVTRIHQEDFCQAMGVPSSLKYQSEGGPNLARCFGLVQSASALPALDRMRLLDVVLFNAMLGNADAHGKNFSLLYTEEGLRLAPFYDLMSTAFYPELSKSFAMKIGEQSRFERLGPKAWGEFSKQIAVTLPFIRQRVLKLADQIPDAVGVVLENLKQPGLDAQAMKQLAGLVMDRAERCARSLAGTSGA
ncbi:MAG: type II toxin-antitoxin system HipA family toxin [Acidobacteria bacterium]|nr:type II toxin-antitoxin system HipA family toxin [Acidobacteriota bacterium]